MRKLRYLGRLFIELFLFARQERIYWILPLVVILLLLTLFIVTHEVVAPFIYTLF